MNKQFPLWLAGVLLCAGLDNASASHTPLALRSGPAMPIHNWVTVQTLSADFGTGQALLPYERTTTYDFYSPPLSQAVDLTTGNKGGGLIFMRNTGTTSADNFTVNGRMKYYDYDPTTGANVLIVDTGVSGPQLVKNGKTVNWSMPNVLLPANFTIPVGHMLHVTMTINLVSGLPGCNGWVIYNGADGASSAAFISQQGEFVDWPFDCSVRCGAVCTIYSIKQQPDGTMLISCAGAASTTYTLQSSLSAEPTAWNTLSTTVSDANGLFSFIDEDGAEYPCCFYRAFTTVP